MLSDAAPSAEPARPPSSSPAASSDDKADSDATPDTDPSRLPVRLPAASSDDKALSDAAPSTETSEGRLSVMSTASRGSGVNNDAAPSTDPASPPVRLPAASSGSGTVTLVTATMTESPALMPLRIVLIGGVREAPVGEVPGCGEQRVGGCHTGSGLDPQRVIRRGIRCAVRSALVEHRSRTGSVYVVVVEVDAGNRCRKFGCE